MDFFGVLRYTHDYFTYTMMAGIMVGRKWRLLQDLPTYSFRKNYHELNLNSQRPHT